jgi:DNA-binding MarR family transcriptional regulator/N-acetylglutamate synthase-like GNAT family acetyltransferase
LPFADPNIAAVRRFNRFYTRRIGVLSQSYLDGRYSLAELRVLYELTRHEQLTASDIAQALGLDHGYLSRILAGFARRKLIARIKAATDGRQRLITLTDKGRREFAPYEQRSQEQVAELIAPLSETEQRRLVGAMAGIEALLSSPATVREPYLLRPHRPGDMGWIVARHGVLYGEEHGWNCEIEAVCADIVAAFLRSFDPARECCWIAEIDGEPVASVLLVRESDTVAKLRLLLVEPRARGLGIGRRLTEECIRFARRAGYRTVTLWTHEVLTAARAIYERAGFRRIRTWTHSDFGKEEVGETWELDLRPAGSTNKQS